MQVNMRCILYAGNIVNWPTPDNARARMAHDRNKCRGANVPAFGGIILLLGANSTIPGVICEIPLFPSFSIQKPSCPAVGQLILFPNEHKMWLWWFSLLAFVKHPHLTVSTHWQFRRKPFMTGLQWFDDDCFDKKITFHSVLFVLISVISCHVYCLQQHCNFQKILQLSGDCAPSTPA